MKTQTVTERMCGKARQRTSSDGSPGFWCRYDGVRAQIHLLPDGTLRFFSRNSKDSSSELPDLIPVMQVRRLLHMSKTCRACVVQHCSYARH